jgi:hypothetical protein
MSSFDLSINKKEKSQDITLLHQSNRKQLLSCLYNNGNFNLTLPEGRAKKRQGHQQNVWSWWWGDACARPSSAVQILQQQKHINFIVFNTPQQSRMFTFSGVVDPT